MDTVRLLGAAQLIVFAASMFSERLLASVVGSGSISDTLVNISKNPTRMRISNMHMLFFCAGGILWYYLLFSSGLAPRGLAISSLAAVCLLSISVLLMLYNRGSTRLMILGLSCAPFELVLGVWLIVK